MEATQKIIHFIFASKNMPHSFALSILRWFLKPAAGRGKGKVRNVFILSKNSIKIEKCGKERMILDLWNKKTPGV